MPAVDADLSSGGGNDPAVEVDVALPRLNALEQYLHKLDPLGRVVGLRVTAIHGAYGAIGRLLPRLLHLDPFGKRECLPATATAEQPAAPTPRAVHLGWR